MRNLVILMVIVILASCGGDKNAMLKQQIDRKKMQISKLEKQIEELEAQLVDTAHTKEAIPVNIKEMKGEEFEHYVIVYGEVEAENYANISPEMPGQIKTIHVAEGQKVNKGDLLISLNTEAIDNSIKQIKTNLDLAIQTYEKQKNLWDKKIGSEIQYLQAKTGKESLESQLKSLKAQKKMAQIRAPFNGYVDKIFQKEGELASSMMPVLEFVNLDELSVTAELSEDYIQNIKKGQLVNITFSSLPHIDINVPILRVSNVINKTSRTFQIEMKFKNQNEIIKPFMVSTIKVNDFSDDNAFVVPSLIIKQDITGKYIFVAKKDGNEFIAEKKYVTPGLSYEDKTVIDAGLINNDLVITNGFNLVSSGLPIEVRN